MYNKNRPETKQTLKQMYKSNMVQVKEQITKSMEPNAKFWSDLYVYRYLILIESKTLAMSVTLHLEQIKKKKKTW